jgi:hypothetical protein
MPLLCQHSPVLICLLTRESTELDATVLSEMYVLYDVRNPLILLEPMSIYQSSQQNTRNPVIKKATVLWLMHS